MTDLPPDSLSDLIGSIYDCAVDPARWPDTLRQVCEALECVASQLYVLDLDTGAHSFATGWGEPPEATRALLERYQGPSADWQRQALATRQPDADPDEPLVLQRLPQAEALAQSEFFRDWAGMLGYCDAIMTVVLRRGRQIGLLGAARHRSVGPATDREVALMRHLAPHLRRAVAIGGLLDMRALEAEALRGTMDGLAVGISVVAADGTLLHANAAAQAMMRDAEGPVREARGRIAAQRPEATKALLAAISAATRPEAELGGQGIGVVLGAPHYAETPALAHVLPLTGMRRRRGLVPHAAAAVFVSPTPARSGAGRVAPLARSLGLTAAEARLLERLAAGDSLAEAQRALRIARTTAKTHLGRIFEKAGVRRQAELAALIERLALPIHRG